MYFIEVNYSNYFNEFEREYEVLKNASDDVLTVSLYILHYIEMKLKKIYKCLKKHIFLSVQEEIYFFKELKPRMVSKLLFYKELLKLEASLPPSKKNKRMYVISNIIAIFLYNNEHY